MIAEDGWAIIPVAGEGTRLRPQTYTTPKALLPVAGKPILGHILDEVLRLGIRKVALVIGHHGEQIVEFAESHYDTCEIAAVRQSEQLGLGHAVYLTRELAEGDLLLIVYGDTVFEADLSRAMEVGADGVIGVRKVDDPRRFGVVELDGNRIVRLVEKPDEFVSDIAIAGINLIQNSGLLFSSLERLIKDGIKTRGEYQLTDGFNKMVSDGAHLETFCVERWFDCGTPDTLLETNRYLLDRLQPPPPSDGAILKPPVFVSESAIVKNSILGPYVSVGERAKITDALIRNSIIGDRAEVTGCFLEESLVGKNAVVKSGPRRVNVGESS